ncbi:polar localization protein TipN [Phenylobacterium sp.]|jgi:hypothetical protein|uniref:polar localization protein TipN n=1 Tax=Phenylobacterium sp. TaxID=1871053 RepID=UPI003784A133
MKIRRRQPPTSFGASNDQEPAPAAEAPRAAADGALPEPEPIVPPKALASARPPLRSARSSSGWPIYLVATVVSGLWALAPLAFAVGYRNRVAPLQDDGFALLVFALLAVGPAALVWGVAYMVRQGQKLAAEARRTQAMAEDMLSPALSAAARAGDVVQAVREEIVAAGAAADQARGTLLALRQAMAEEALRLTDATRASVRTAQELTGALGQERTEIGALAETLSARAGEVAETISGQVRRVAEAADAAGDRLKAAEADLAGTLEAQAAKTTEALGQQARILTEAAEVADVRLRDAEASLAARAGAVTAAAAEVGDAARVAAEDLDRHIARLETAGSGVADQVRAVEGGLVQHRETLSALSQALRADQQAFAADADGHAERLGEFIAQARLSAAEMSERALRGSETLKALMADAAEQFRDLAETARAEREEFGQSTLQSLEAVSAAAAEQRAKLETQTRGAIDALARAAEETREAAARHAAAARDQVDQLSEAAFSAGQKANQVFEARLAEAKALVEQSSQMVEQAGQATARKLDEGAAAARATLGELQTMLGELDERARRLPQTARGQAEEVRATVAQGMDELMEAARRTAEEAEAIDAAFQDRVRRNFEMLSEAVRLMGTAAAAPAAPPPPIPRAEPTPRARTRAAAPPPAPEPSVDDIDDQQPQVEDAPGAVLAERLGLRPRLKLAPTATDAEFSQVFEAAGGPVPPKPAPAKGSEGWTWTDLLASVDGGVGDAEKLEARLTSELAGMGIDPEKLLPKPRIDEVAAAVQTGDIDGARQVVKKLAPAATRRIVRRLFTDEALRADVTSYLRRYQALVDDAVVRDPEGFLMSSLLAADAGRTYLLLDAAVGDMA